MQTTQRKKRRLAGWTTRDILVTAAIAVVFGLVLAGATQIAVTLYAAITPAFADVIMMPVFLLPGLITPYILRKPGAAFLTQLLAGLVLAPFSPYGFMHVFGQVISGVTCELPFLITRYRRWGLTMLIVAGALVAVMQYAISGFMGSLVNLTPMLLLGLAVAQLVGGALSGLLAKVLADAIAKTGVLSAFAIAQETVEEV
jgi:energy-coupling factor transport system substrate-specific component